MSTADYYLPYQPSLASATNTRVDSACKHHHQCRVSTEDIQRLMNPMDNPDKILREKYKYCVHKDEFVVSIGRPWCKELAIRKNNNAYPRVISSLGDMDGSDERSVTYQKMVNYMYHFCKSLKDKEDIVNIFKDKKVVVPIEFVTPGTRASQFFGYFKIKPNPAPVPGSPRISNVELEEDTASILPLMHDFTSMGYAQTLGWAHANSGDTMTTVMIGGCRTVMNGDFEIQTNDIIQWYWPFELECFTPRGHRKKIAGNINPVAHLFNMKPSLAIKDIFNVAGGGGGAGGNPNNDQSWSLPKDAKGREEFHTQIFGQTKRHPKVVARIKPYFEDQEYPRLHDRMRVFAVAISSARPHEMVDIKICRQSM